MTDVVLYGNAVSTFVRTARMACVEKGVSYDLQPLEFGSEAHLAIHSFGKMPAMRHGDFTLFETSAITRYIDDRFPGPRLQPDDPRERALMNQWISATNHYFYADVIVRYLLQYFFPKGPDGTPDREAIDAALPDVRHHLGVLDKALDDKEFLVGDRITLADLFLAPILSYLVKAPRISGNC